jgi:hypothetical protein
MVLIAIVAVGALAAPGISAHAQSAQSQGSKTAQSSPSGVKHSAASRKAEPDPNLDLVGSWGSVPGDETSDITIEIGKNELNRVTVCWLTVGQVREQCDFKRMGKRLAVNGYGVPDDQNPTPENFIVLAGLQGDVMKGTVYPSKSEFTIYLHGGPSEAKLLQDIAEKKAAEELARQQEEQRVAPLKAASGNWKFVDTENYYFSKRNPDIYSRYDGEISADFVNKEGSYRFTRHQMLSDSTMRDFNFNGSVVFCGGSEQVAFCRLGEEQGSSDGYIVCSMEALRQARQNGSAANCTHYPGEDGTTIPTLFYPE